MSLNIAVAPPLERLVPLFPQLEIDGMVAVNELAAVFRARQTGLDRRVALKILPESIAGNENLVDAFTADARTMAPLQHPNLVRIFDFGESDGLLWMIQEWIEGQTLREILAEGAMSVPRTGELLSQICRGLGHAHAHGAIHGDIRASHVMLDEQGRVKLMNFGLGRLVLAEADINMPGVVAPELLDPDLEVDHRADIFALGVMLYEMLVGERPVGEVEMPSVVRPGVVGPGFDVVAAGCLHPDPERRFQDCDALRKALEELVNVPAPGMMAQPATKLVPRMTGAAPIRRPQPVYFPDVHAGRPKWPLILALLVAIAIGGWFVKRHHANIKQIQAEHDRKIRDVKEKIAENERAMKQAKRAEKDGVGETPARNAPDPEDRAKEQDPPSDQDAIAAAEPEFESSPTTVTQQPAEPRPEPEPLSPDEILSEMEARSAANPEDTVFAMHLAALAVWFGKDDQYEATSKRMLEWAEGTDEFYTAERVAKLCSLRPQSDPKTRERIVALAKRGVQLAGDNAYNLGWANLALGLAEFQNRNDRAAHAAFTVATSKPDEISEYVRDTAGLYLAMLFLRNNNAPEAKQRLRATEARIPPLPSDDRHPPLRHGAQDALILWLAYKQACALLEHP